MYLQISSVSGRWCVRLGLFGAIVGSAVAFGSTALAQVVPDNTVGSAVSGVGGEQTITGGTRQGGNLFHSFDQFSVPTNGTAFFNNATDIQNILSRVTGGSISNIDGLIRANGAANLFLLNPNGIIFGPNARLDVGGSFIATTASSINFADGTQFSATPGTTGAPLLTVSVPLGLQFGTGAGEIVNRSRAVDGNNFPVGLQVDPGKTLGLIGGNVNLEGSRLTARGGRVELGAVAAPGVVGINPDSSGFRFSFPTDLVLGDISLTNLSVVDVAADRGGSIATNSQNLSLAQGSNMGAGIRSGFGLPDSKAGNIEINATGRIALADGSFITNSVQRGAVGNSGDLNVTAGTLELIGGGQLEASTYGKGNAGNMNINASSITFSGVINQRTSGILSNVEDGANGTGGIINIKADSLSLTDGGQIQAIVRSTSDTLPGGNGNAGKVIIDVRGSFDISGVNGVYPSAVFTSVGFGATGKGGDIDIKARSLSLNNGARLTTITEGQGNAGNIEIVASDVNESITMNGSFITTDSNSTTGNAGNITIAANGRMRAERDSRVTSSLQQTQQTAQANRRSGDISIKAGSLFLTSGSQVGATTFSRGDAGDVTLDISDTILIEGVGTGDFQSGIFSNVQGNGIGKNGNIKIATGSLSLRDRGIISASTLSGEGDAGSITITASDRVSLDGSLVQTTYAGTSTGLNNRKGGDINIKARSLSLTEGAQINTSTYGQGNAGNIQIAATDPMDSMFISKNSLVITSSYSTTSNAGNITIDAEGKIAMDGDSQVTSSLQPIQETPQLARRSGDIRIKARSLFLRSGALLGASTFSRGDAGDVTLDISDNISIEGVGAGNFQSGIFSNVQGNGIGKNGNIKIATDSLSLRDRGIISASTLLGEGEAGSIAISASSDISLDRGIISSTYTGTLPGQGNRKGGDINIKARSLSLANGAYIDASNIGTGDAGNINIGVRTLDLDRGGIFAESTSGNGGNIELRASKSVRLRSGSQISTSAGGTEQGGNGGNITINSPLVIANANGNNDITANAFRGSGGRIEINAQGIFGLTRIDGETLLSLLGTDTPSAEDFYSVFNQLSSNDVAAISLTDPSLSNVSFNAADIDPSRDIVKLPTGLVDASSLVAAGCPSGAENRFTVAGRGGLPPAPADKLSSDALLTDWATLQTPETQNRATVEPTTPVATNTILTPPVETITEATSWQYDRNGAIILTSGDTTSSSHLKTTPTSCPSS